MARAWYSHGLNALCHLPVYARVTKCGLHNENASLTRYRISDQTRLRLHVIHHSIIRSIRCVKKRDSAVALICISKMLALSYHYQGKLGKKGSIYI